MNLPFAPALAALGRASLQSLAGFGYAGMLLAESLWFSLVGWRRGQPVRIAQPGARQAQGAGAGAPRS